MATLLDSLFFSIGWDTKDFDRGKRSVDKGFRDTKESAHKEATEIEAAGRRAAGFFRSLRNETAGLILTFAGASSLKGFLGDIIDTAANTDRLAKNMGVARNELYAWQNLLKSNGGSPGDATSALQTMANQIQARKLGVQTGNEANLMGLGVTPGDMTSPDAMLLKIAQASRGMDRATYSSRLSMLGFSPEMIDLMARGRGELQKQLEVQRQQATITDKDVEAARKFQEVWADIGTTIKGRVMPAVTPFLQWLDDTLKSGNGIVDISPLLVGGITAIAAAALAAAGPWAALGGAIGLAVIAFKDWERLQNMSKEDRDKFDKRGAELRGQLWDRLSNGDVGGALGVIGQGFSERAFGNGGLGPSGAPAGAGGNVSSLFTVLERKYGTARARGIWAGIGAESGWNPSNVNPTSGAYGLGQWLGPRKKALFARYGRNPGAADQIAFLMSELEGGDRGGASVLSSRSSGEALNNYITRFMRPKAGYETNRDLAAGARFLGQGGSVSIGTMHINSNAADGKGVARDVVGALRGRNIIINSASGLSQ